MSITKRTAEYEAWLGSQTILDSREINVKHKKMAGSEFAFLRATFYRWAQLFPKHCPDLYQAPRILGVGDLHLENFGTWRDDEGRLNWGVNDFDEACFLPYTNDLIRLATSAYFALTDPLKPLRLDFKAACQAIQTGYLSGLENPRPFILAEDHGWLRNVVMRKLITPNAANQDDLFKRFHKKYMTLEAITGAVPNAAITALNAGFPQPLPQYDIRHREAGLGSLGRQRFTAVASDWQGGIIVREAKALVPSAWLWANQGRGEPYASAFTQNRIYYPEIVTSSVRAADPWLMVFDRWVVRRLGPDAFKVEIQGIELKPREEEELTRKLFKAMGKEVANIHASGSGSAHGIVDHLKTLSTNFQSVKWLLDGAMNMVKQTQEDFHDWKQAGNQGS
jgi:hypothetical protein